MGVMVTLAGGLRQEGHMGHMGHMLVTVFLGNQRWISHVDSWSCAFGQGSTGWLVMILHKNYCITGQRKVNTVLLLFCLLPSRGETPATETATHFDCPGV